MLKPADPLQYIIDSVEQQGTGSASQDAATGLPEHRKAKLIEVFSVMDKVGHGHASQGHAVR